MMPTILKTFGASALLGFLLILPFMIMEIVNRRNYHEDFPFMLFFVMWLNFFVISAILLPILLGMRKTSHDPANPAPEHEKALLTNPKPALIISAILLLFPLLLFRLNSLGWVDLDRLFNGPNPEQPYVFGQILSLAFILFPVAAGIIAGRPIISTLRGGGSLFAHPVHLIIVVFILSAFAYGLANTIIDQWPCFIGVPFCD